MLASKPSATTETKRVRRIVLRFEAEQSSLIDGENQFGELISIHIVTQWLTAMRSEHRIWKVSAFGFVRCQSNDDFDRMVWRRLTASEMAHRIVKCVFIATNGYCRRSKESGECNGVFCPKQNGCEG